MSPGTGIIDHLLENLTCGFGAARDIAPLPNEIRKNRIEIGFAVFAKVIGQDADADLAFLWAKMFAAEIDRNVFRPHGGVVTICGIWFVTRRERGVVFYLVVENDNKICDNKSFN